jgi:hypothetical protein
MRQKGVGRERALGKLTASFAGTAVPAARFIGNNPVGT